MPTSGELIASSNKRRSVVKPWRPPSFAKPLDRATDARSPGANASTAAAAISWADRTAGPAGMDRSKRMVTSRPSAGRSFVARSCGASRVHGAVAESLVVGDRTGPGRSTAAKAATGRGFPSSKMTKSDADRFRTGLRSRSSTETSTEISSVFARNVDCGGTAPCPEVVDAGQSARANNTQHRDARCRMFMRRIRVTFPAAGQSPSGDRTDRRGVQGAIRRRPRPR